MEKSLFEQMAARQGITEALKIQDQMAWVGRMNNICTAVNQMVQTELICV